MTVLYHEWGKVVGGVTSGSVPVVTDAASYGPAETFHGILGVGNTTITFSKPTKHVTIRNTDDGDSLEYSFDGGVTWLLAISYQVIQEAVSVSNFLMRNVGAGVASYEIVAVLQS
jgi:hypothetical protein